MRRSFEWLGLVAMVVSGCAVVEGDSGASTPGGTRRVAWEEREPRAADDEPDEDDVIGPPDAGPLPVPDPPPRTGPITPDPIACLPDDGIRVPGLRPPDGDWDTPSCKPGLGEPALTPFALVTPLPCAADEPMRPPLGTACEVRKYAEDGTLLARHRPLPPQYPVTTPPPSPRGLLPVSGSLDATLYVTRYSCDGRPVRWDEFRVGAYHDSGTYRTDAAGRITAQLGSYSDSRWGYDDAGRIRAYSMTAMDGMTFDVNERWDSQGRRLSETWCNHSSCHHRCIELEADDVKVIRSFASGANSQSGQVTWFHLVGGEEVLRWSVDWRDDFLSETRTEKRFAARRLLSCAGGLVREEWDVDANGTVDTVTTWSPLREGEIHEQGADPGGKPYGGVTVHDFDCTD